MLRIAVFPRGFSLKRWILEEQTKPKHDGKKHHATHTWWKVMCLTGVDYFSTLGYQPGIAALAAGALSPFATLVLVLLTIFGALPIYRRVAKSSPHGEGSIAMLEHLLSWWQGKLFVLCLLGFVATDFIITITLSAADATAHLRENPLTGGLVGNHVILVTLILITGLAGVFLKGFKEAISTAVVLVVVYLCLNIVVVTVGLFQVFVVQPHVLVDWKIALFAQHGNPLIMIGMSVLLFPKLALGLSGFETGVAVMPEVQGDEDDDEQRPQGRIRNTHKLLKSAAIIMSVFLLSSSLVTTCLIPAEAFEKGGDANGRALAFLAHEYLGKWFGTLYDFSTISILWFAGASAMAGLLHILPRYLPRYGMAPAWASLTRPLVLVLTAIAFAVTIIFSADVDAQGGAYATGVLVLMTSAAFAVSLEIWRKGERQKAYLFFGIVGLFLYTTAVNMVERPEGLKIASFFIGAIMVTSVVYRIYASTSLRVDLNDIRVDEGTEQLIQEACNGKKLSCISKRPNGHEFTYSELASKEGRIRAKNRLPDDSTLVYFVVHKTDSSNYMERLCVTRKDVHGKDAQGNDRSYIVLHCAYPVVPNAITGFMFYLRDRTGKIPHTNMDWTEGSALSNAAKLVLFGEGDTASVCRYITMLHEPNPELRPLYHTS